MLQRESEVRRYMVIAKQDGTEFELNTEKIAAAIRSACEAASEIYERFVSKVSSLLKKLLENMWEFLKRHFGRLAGKICSFKEKHRPGVPWLAALSILKVSIPASYVKLLVLAFEAAACKIRTTYLQRTQHRGSDHSNDEIVMICR